MKKLVFLTAIAAFAITTASAQFGRDKYQWEIDFGYTAHFKDTYGRFNLRTVHGFRFNEYFFLGAGTGLDIYHGVYHLDSDGARNRAQVALPLYVNIKGYIPVAESLYVMLGTDLGYSIGFAGTPKYSAGTTLSGALFMPEAGIAYQFHNGPMITFGLGYSVNSARAYARTGSTKTTENGNNNGFSLRFGLVF